jgi:hypothetical protein
MCWADANSTLNLLYNFLSYTYRKLMPHGTFHVKSLHKYRSSLITLVFNFAKHKGMRILALEQL